MAIERIGRRIWLIAIMGVAGCLHRSPEERILTAFSNDGSEPFFFPEGQPQYLLFADERTARVLWRIKRDGHYAMAPEHSKLFCPKAKVAGLHGYLISASVDTVMGDSAIASLNLDCAQAPPPCPDAKQSCVIWSAGMIRMSTNYLLVRRAGKWKVEKPISGSVGIAM